MIISKKKFNEKVQEALNRAEHERWLMNRIENVGRECNERIEGVLRYVSELEKKIEELSGERGRMKYD